MTTVPVAERWVPAGTWTADRVLEALWDWTREVGRRPWSYEWSTALARAHRSREWERWAREYPRWPSADTVAEYHGSWGAALLAAGLPGGRSLLEIPFNERVEAAQRMHSLGAPATEIALELGVRVATARSYLVAARCASDRNWMIRGPCCLQCAREEAQRLAATRPQWDRQSVIDALRRWTVETGEPPSPWAWASGRKAHGRWLREYPQWPRTNTVRGRLGGSWNAALEAAGLPAVAHGRFSDEDVIAELRADAQRLGRSPVIEDWRRRRTPGVPGFGAVVSHFGSWNAAIRAAGLKPAHDRHAWTREQVLTALRDDAQRQGRIPTSREWEQRPGAARPGYSAVRKHIGSWNTAIEAAGLVRDDPKWTRETVLRALRELERELGRQPTSGDVRGPADVYPSAMVIRRTFGSWAAACHELGWRTRKPPASDQELLDAVQAAVAELGRVSRDRYQVIAAARGWPSAKAIVRRFGTPA